MFVVDVSVESMKVTAMRVMRAMRSHLTDLYQLRATGRENSQACEEIARQLTKWIVVDDIIARRVGQQSEIVIVFKRAEHFKDRFLDLKSKVRDKRLKEEQEKRESKPKKPKQACLLDEDPSDDADSQSTPN